MRALTTGLAAGGFCAAGVWAGGGAGAAPPKIRPVQGVFKKVKVKKGDTLYRIARRHDVGAGALARLNGLGGRRVRPGRSLLLPTLFIPPRALDAGVALSVPERTIYLFDGGRIKGRFAAAVGSPRTPTPSGTYRVVSRITNPKWDPPADLAKRRGIKDELVGPGPENPLGDRWIGWNLPGYGFHSTNAPRSIGGAVSNGCVRLYPEQARRMFEAVRVGMPIVSEYEPVRLGARGGRVYLSVSPDPYGRGLSSRRRVEELLRRAGLLGLVRPDVLRRVVARQESYPRRVLGEAEALTANGEPVRAALAPVLVSGTWFVPAREVVTALGGDIKPEAGGAVRVALGGKAVVFTPGARRAKLDNAPFLLPAAPARASGTLLVPLGALKKLGVRADWKRGKTLALSA